jgi:hypothetical protein
MVNGANKRIQSNVGNSLMTALKARLSDANKNLVIQTLELLSLLATVRKRKRQRERDKEKAQRLLTCNFVTLGDGT